MTKANFGKDLITSLEHNKDTFFATFMAETDNIPAFYHPMEIGRNTYKITLKKEDFKIEFAKEMITKSMIDPFYQFKSLKTQTEFDGDGYTRTFSFINLGIVQRGDKYFIDLKDDSAIEVNNPYI